MRIAAFGKCKYRQNFRNHLKFFCHAEPFSAVHQTFVVVVWNHCWAGLFHFQALKNGVDNTVSHNRMETIMRKTILAIALASGCLVGLQTAAFADPQAAAPQTLDTNGAASPQGSRSGTSTQPQGLGSSEHVTPRPSDPTVSAPSPTGH
jgi:hypothetical protein